MSKENREPPKWAIQLLTWICPENLFEGILGDLLEQYHADCNQYHIYHANGRFIYNVIRFFHPVLLKEKKFYPDIIIFRMLSNYFKVSFRGMKKSPFYTITNLLGLALAIAFVFTIFLFVQHTFKQDAFHQHKNDIYRLFTKHIDKTNGTIKRQSAVTAVPLSEVIASEIGEITDFTRVASSTKTITINDNHFEQSVHFVDHSFFNIFSFPILQSNGREIEDNNIFISEELKIKLFGDEDPIGKVLKIDINDEDVLLHIAGIVDNRKKDSSIKFDLLASMEVFKKEISEDAFNSMNYGIVENYIVYKGNTFQDIQHLMSEAVRKFFSEDEKIEVNIGMQAMSSIHFETAVVGYAAYSDPQKVYILASLALVILIISLLNFITLSSSKSLARIREMGVRGVMGAYKDNIKIQFIVESCTITMISSIIGVLIAAILMPYLSFMIGADIAFSFGIYEVAFIFITLLFLAVINGLIQYQTVQRYSIKEALLSKVNGTKRNTFLNKYLLTTEFVFAIILVISAICIKMQMQFIGQKTLGFEEERLLQISINSTKDEASVKSWFETFKLKAEQHRNIHFVSASMDNIQEPWTQLKFDQEQGEPAALFYNQVSPDYIKTIGANLIIGKDFADNQALNKRSIIVNEALVKHFNWENPLDEQIPGKNIAEGHEIIGVVKNFHFSSLHDQIEPLILATNLEAIEEGITGLSTYVWPAKYYQLMVRIGSGEISPTIAYLEDIWKQNTVETPFVYHFTDTLLEQKYEEEKRWSKIMDWASIFAILISFIGLLGLLQLSLKRRTKEIGVRKILGASPLNIIKLLTGQYFILILLSNLISLPISWLLMQQWLTSFTYKIEITPFVLISASASVFIVALIVMMLQIRKVLNTTAVDTLIDE